MALPRTGVACQFCSCLVLPGLSVGAHVTLTVRSASWEGAEVPVSVLGVLLVVELSVASGGLAGPSWS